MWIFKMIPKYQFKSVKIAPPQSITTSKVKTLNCWPKTLKQGQPGKTRLGSSEKSWLEMFGKQGVDFKEMN